MKKHLTVKEVAEILRRCPKTIKNMIASGQINAFKLVPGRYSRYLISSEEIDRLIKAGQVNHVKQG